MTGHLRIVEKLKPYKKYGQVFYRRKLAEHGLTLRDVANLKDRERRKKARRAAGQSAFIPRATRKVESEPTPKNVVSLSMARAKQKSNRHQTDIHGRLVLEELPRTILVISDLQIPYHLKGAIKFLRSVADYYEPDLVVSIGDEGDLNWLSRHPKVPEIDAPCRELYELRLGMREFFAAFPAGIGLTSNHVHGRLEAKRQECRMPRELFPTWEQLCGAPDTWQWVNELQVGHVLFRHGHNPKNKLTQMALLRQIPKVYGCHLTAISGHLHTEHGIVASVQIGTRDYFAAYTGCLMDPQSDAAKYGHGPSMMLGCLVIQDGVPIRITYEVDPVTGEWTGEW